MPFFTPSCPVNLREKVWTERRLQWLTQQFGIQRLLDATFVEPDAAFFPVDYQPDEQGAKDMLRRVCEYMRQPQDQFRLSFVSSDNSGVPLQNFSAGDDRTPIELDQALLTNPVAVISMISSQLARDEILGGDSPRLNGESGDAWSVADLYVVFSGLGVFQALAPVKATGPAVSWENVTIRRQGNLPARMIGYALALCAWARDELKPEWERSLLGETRSSLRAGLKFLRKTQDCVFAPHSATPPPSDATEVLRNGTPSQRVNTMLELQAVGPNSDLAMPLAENLFDGNPILVSEALRTLGDIGPDARHAALDKTLDLFHSSNSEVRSSAMLAATSLEPNPQADTGSGLTMPERIGACLEDNNPAIVQSALAALHRYGHADDAVSSRIVPQLSIAARNCDYSTLAAFLLGLKNVVPDLQQFLVEQTGTLDAEIREQIEYQYTALFVPSDEETATMSSDKTV